MLNELRNQIDACDRELLATIARRLELCNEVAKVKGENNNLVLAPQRVNQVLQTRSEWARELGVEPEFAELLFRSLLSETHRIEALHLNDSNKAPTNLQASLPATNSPLQTASVRVDHVTVAVKNLDAAIEFFVHKLGFRVLQERQTHTDTSVESVVVDAGGVTFVLVQDSVTDRAIGVHHVAIEVLNAGFIRDSLAANDCPLETDLMVGHDGLERFFAVRDASSGLQLGFVSRTGQRGVFNGSDVANLSAALEANQTP